MRNKILALFALLIVMSFISPQAFGQTISDPSPVRETTISMEPWGDINITASIGWDGSVLSGSLKFETDELHININLAPDENYPTLIEISAGGDRAGRWAMGPEIRSYSGAGDSAVDITSMPPYEKMLWEHGMDLVGDLNNSVEFHNFIDAGDKEELLRSQLREFAEGYHSPSVTKSYIDIRRIIGPVPMIYRTLGRGFLIQTCGDFTQVRIVTTDPVGDENPVLYVDLIEPDSGDVWYLSMFPESETCEIAMYSRTRTDSREITEAEWNPQIDKFESLLEFLNEQVPLFEEFGISGDREELGLFVNLCLERLKSYLRVPSEFPPSAD